MDIVYRHAVLADLDQIDALVKNAIHTMRMQKIEQWDEIYPDREILKEDIQNNQLYVGIWNERIVVIYVLNQKCDDAYQDGAWKEKHISFYVIHRLCVNPEFQRMGIAKKTMIHIEQQLLEMEIHNVRLDVYSKNPYALKLYDQFGFRNVGYADWRKGRFYLMEKYI